MADRPHLRLADHTDLANDDPFAELTRIMGFDPRQPVASAPASGQASAAPAPGPTAAALASEPAAAALVEDGFDEMDFTIDLEKELMGDFADAPEAVAASPSSFDVWPQAVEPAAQNASEPAAQAAVSNAPLGAEEDEIAFDADWFTDDAADEKAPEAFASPEPEVGSYDLADARDPREASPAVLEQDARSTIPQPANDVPPIEALDPLADLDFHADDLTDTAVPEEFVVDNHDIGDHTADVYAAELPADEAADEVDIDDVFASAFDDVDPRYDDAAPAASADEDQFDDLDRELDLSLRGGFTHADAQDDDAGTEMSSDVQGPEMSLEDELNALLGNALAQPARPLASAAPAAALPTEPSVPDALEEHVSERQYQPLSLAPVDEPDDVALETAAFEWPEAADDLVPVEADAGEHDLRGADETDVEGELDMDFDDQAFEAAISRSINAEAPVEEYVADAEGVEEFSEKAAAAPQDDYSPYAALAAMSASLKPARAWPRETPFVERREIAAAPVRHADEPELAFDPEPAFQPDVTMAQHRPAYEPEIALPQEATYEPEPIFVAEPATAPVRHVSGAPAYRDSYVPDIDTLDVPEQAVALADDLDLPEFTYEDDPAPAPSYDDIDAEFTSLLNEMNASEDEPPAPVRSGRYDDYHDDYRAPSSPRIEMPALAGAGYAAPRQDAPASAVVSPAPRQPLASDLAMSSQRDIPAAVRDSSDSLVDQELADMEFAYDPDLDEEMALPAHMPAQQSPSPRRGMMAAAVIGGVAILGGIGALAMSFGGGAGSNEPVLVRADDTPVKVKPENPGGTTIPNQDNKVYDSVAGGTAPADPQQEKLVSTEEEPIEMPSPVPMDDVDAMEDGGADATATADAEAIPPSQKAEDRIEQVIDDAGVDNSVEVAAVAPRKVRTMIVKADGTLVAREEPTPAPAAETAAAGITDPVPTAGPATGTVAPVEEPTDVASAPAVEDTLPIATAPAEPVPAPALAPATTDAPTPAEALAPAAPAGQEQSSETPSKAPIAPARPSDQPVDIVGEVKPEKVAAVSSAAAAPGAWAMQIASQPTEAAAKSSYQDLLRRYGSVLEGRQANIVKAEISGKGTFWRVRVAAGSRNEAVSLCESYKSAGGNCFVSK